MKRRRKKKFSLKEKVQALEHLRALMEERPDTFWPDVRDALTAVVDWLLAKPEKRLPGKRAAPRESGNWAICMKAHKLRLKGKSWAEIEEELWDQMSAEARKRPQWLSKTYNELLPEIVWRPIREEVQKRFAGMAKLQAPKRKPWKAGDPIPGEE